jgi:hypothetical protein
VDADVVKTVALTEPASTGRGELRTPDYGSVRGMMAKQTRSVGVRDLIAARLRVDF